MHEQHVWPPPLPQTIQKSHSTIPFHHSIPVEHSTNSIPPALLYPVPYLAGSSGPGIQWFHVLVDLKVILVLLNVPQEDLPVGAPPYDEVRVRGVEPGGTWRTKPHITMEMNFELLEKTVVCVGQKTCTKSGPN